MEESRIELKYFSRRKYKNQTHLSKTRNRIQYEIMHKNDDLYRRVIILYVADTAVISFPMTVIYFFRQKYNERFARDWFVI